MCLIKEKKPNVRGPGTEAHVHLFSFQQLNDHNSTHTHTHPKTSKKNLISNTIKNSFQTPKKAFDSP